MYDLLTDIHKNRPVDEPLAQQLEDAYQSIKPWKPSYQEEVLATLQVGPAAYEKLKCPLPDGSVFFDDASSARLISNSFTNRMSSAFFSTLRGGKQISPYPASPLVYRGYDEAVRRANVPSRPVSASPSRASSVPAGSSESEQRTRRKSLDAKTAAKFSQERGRRVTQGVTLGDTISQDQFEETRPSDNAKVGEGPSEDVSDLIFVVHGIGQGVSFSFILMNLNRI